jgi:hypothetical protein
MDSLMSKFPTEVPVQRTAKVWESSFHSSSHTGWCLGGREAGGGGVRGCVKEKLDIGNLRPFTFL